jgi:hypothetical protein
LARAGQIPVVGLIARARMRTLFVIEIGPTYSRAEACGEFPVRHAWITRTSQRVEILGAVVFAVICRIKRPRS